MKARYAFASLFLMISYGAWAQDYCSPSFANGCFNWRTLSVEAGDIYWAAGADDCSMADYSTISTDVNAGAALPMSVSNGTWCGCAVWVDLDQSGSFEASENLYYAYVGGSPSHLYEFEITLPSGLVTGAYRMRIVSPWGSDGFLTANGNGNGPCGAYQYGDFKDFTLNISGTNGLDEINASGMRLSPNPARGLFTLSGVPIGSTVQAVDASGRLMARAAAIADRIVLDAATWPSGVYALRVAHADGNRVLRLVVE